MLPSGSIRKRGKALSADRADSEAVNLVWFVTPALIVMGLIFLIPLGYVFYFSLIIDEQLRFDGFLALLNSGVFYRVFFTTLEISILSTLVSVFLGYFVALHLSRLEPRIRIIYMSMVMLPFWTSVLVKSYSFTLILGRHGVINSVLTFMFGDAVRMELIYNRIGVVVGMTNYLIPFVVFPILANLLAQDRNLRTAAEIMGAKPFRIFTSITLPLSLPGVLAGAVMCMVLSFGFFITPAILGGRRDIMLSNLIDLYTRETLNWNLAATAGVSLLLVTALLAGILSRVPGTRNVLQ